MNNSQPDFRQQQQAFAAHIRDPENSGCPEGIEDRRMKIYRDLFFGNVMSFLDGAFPVLKDIFGESRWTEIGRDFFIRHKCETPYFLEISEEFLAYLESEFVPAEGDPVYAYELAHYEWLELHVDVQQENPARPFNANGDLLEGNIVLAPVVEGFLYRYPVHQVSADNPDPEPSATALIVYRSREDEIRFAETNPFTLQLLALLKEESLSGREAIAKLLDINGYSGNDAAFQGGVQTLELWLSLGIILGAEA